MPGGAETMVDIHNVEEYIQLVTDFCMHSGIQSQLDAFTGSCLLAVVGVGTLTLMGVDILTIVGGGYTRLLKGVATSDIRSRKNRVSIVTLIFILTSIFLCTLQTDSIAYSQWRSYIHLALVN